MAKITKYRAESQTKVVLEQNANPGDYLDLSESIKIDTSSLIKGFGKEIETKAEERAIELAKMSQNDEIKNLKEEIAQLKQDKIEALRQNDKQHIEKIEKIKKDKENEIDVLKTKIDAYERKNWYKSTKDIGEDLEQYLVDQFDEAQRNGGFLNCSFEKINIAKTSSKNGDKPTKGDFLFKCYKQSDDNVPLEEREVLFTILVEAKHHDINSKTNIKNSAHLPTVQLNVNKEKADYGLLVTTLELDPTKEDKYEGITSAVGYENIYIARPRNMLTFFNLAMKMHSKRNALTIPEEQLNILQNPNEFIKEWETYINDVTYSSEQAESNLFEIVKYCINGIKFFKDMGLAAVAASKHLNRTHKKIYTDNKFFKKLRTAKDISEDWNKLSDKVQKVLAKKEQDKVEKKLVDFTSNKKTNDDDLSDDE